MAQKPIIEIIESPRQIELQAETDLPVTIPCVPAGQGVTTPGQVSPGVFSFLIFKQNKDALLSS